jgi:hypothetical protein
MPSQALSRWSVQSLAGVLLVTLISIGFSYVSAEQSPAAQQSSAGSNGDACAEGYFGSPATGCADVNECASGNGGCHKLAMCRNSPGSRTCGDCPKGFQGDGYVGCFDVNECPNGDCTDRIPKDAESTPPPVVTTSGDVTAAAVSESGAPATFTVSATDSKDGVRPAYCLPRSGSTFAIGKTVVSCWAVNTRGKIGRQTLTVTVSRPAL